MSIGEKIGGAIGAVVGTVFGPVGTIAGTKAGEYVGDAIEGAIAPEAPPIVEAPTPKPLVASKSAWFGLLFAVVPAVLQWGLDFDWTQVVSPTAAAVIGGACFIGLRLVSVGAIGRG